MIKFTAINEKKSNKKVFLGGTCNDSDWREKLIDKLKIDYFNPVVPNWDDKAKERELKERETADYLLYVITPRMNGVYSIAECVDDSNKNPDKTIFCFLKTDKDDKGEKIEFEDFQINSLNEVGKLIVRNGGIWLKSLDEVAKKLNENE